MVVGGTVVWPTLGILDAAGQGVDLRDCGILNPGSAPPSPPSQRRSSRSRGSAPTTYPGVGASSVPAGDGVSGRGADGAVRAALGGGYQLGEHLPALLATMPRLRVVSADIHPEHKAVLEGEVEVPLTRIGRRCRSRWAT